MDDAERRLAEIGHGTPEMLRECTAEMLHLTAFYCSNGVAYAEVQDDAGLEYSTRAAVAHFRQALRILAMLKDARARAKAAKADE